VFGILNIENIMNICKFDIYIFTRFYNFNFHEIKNLRVSHCFFLSNYRDTSRHEIDNPEMFSASTSTSIQSTSESQISDNNHRQPRKRRRTYANRKNDHFCNSEETEFIHQAL